MSCCSTSISEWKTVLPDRTQLQRAERCRLDHVYNVKLKYKMESLPLLLELVISITNPNPSTGEMLDSTFGTNGAVATKFNGLPSSTRDIVLQADGKIVVLGDMQSTKVIARYNNNGTLDTSFGTSGITSIDFPSFFVKKLALQSDGKLIVAGQQRGFAAVRYNSNGTLDTSFGTNGLAALNPLIPAPTFTIPSKMWQSNLTEK